MNIENPAFDYDAKGQKYSGQRKTDSRIARYIYDALGDAKNILNVGAGSGSYEPLDKYVIAVEPSITMRTQRNANGKVPAINAKADNLPFDDNSFDAAMALLTVHHWPDMAKGLKELRRVTKNQLIILTFDPTALDRFWNVHYFPELIEVEKARYPTLDFIKNAVGGTCNIVEVPIPLDCADGFQEAYYGRPEEFLKKEVRKSQSAWSFLAPGLEEQYVQALQNELSSGAWDKKFGNYRTQTSCVFALRLLLFNP